MRTSLAAALAGLAALLAGTAAQARDPAAPQQEAIERGGEDFSRYCAACHGADARGQGPVAQLLVRKPPDLTLLAARNYGAFPTDAVYWIVDGRGDVAAHGPREMPVWGEQLGGPEADEKATREQILDIIAWLQSVQRESPANPLPRE